MLLTVDFSALLAAVRQMGAEQIEPPLIRPLGAAPLDPIDIALSETGIDVILKDVDRKTVARAKSITSPFAKRSVK